MARPPYPGKLHYFIGSKTRALIIERLVKHPDNEPCFRELGRNVNAGMGALHRELTELQRIGLVQSSVRGGARYFALNLDHPLAGPLCALVAACDQVDSHERDARTNARYRGVCAPADRLTPLSGHEVPLVAPVHPLVSKLDISQESPCAPLEGRIEW